MDIMKAKIVAFVACFCPCKLVVLPEPTPRGVDIGEKHETEG